MCCVCNAQRCISLYTGKKPSLISAWDPRFRCPVFPESGISGRSLHTFNMNYSSASRIASASASPLPFPAGSFRHCGRVCCTFGILISNCQLDLSTFDRLLAWLAELWLPSSLPQRKFVKLFAHYQARETKPQLEMTWLYWRRLLAIKFDFKMCQVCFKCD